MSFVVVNSDTLAPISNRRHPDWIEANTEIDDIEYGAIAHHTEQSLANMSIAEINSDGIINNVMEPV